MLLQLSEKTHGELQLLAWSSWTPIPDKKKHNFKSGQEGVTITGPLSLVGAYTVCTHLTVEIAPVNPGDRPKVAVVYTGAYTGREVGDFITGEIDRSLFCPETGCVISTIDSGVPGIGWDKLAAIVTDALDTWVKELSPKAR